MRIYTEMDINRVYIVMGIRCNFNCKYCYEKKMHQEDCSVSPKLINYLTRLTEIRPFTSKDNPVHIIFWGGEPLLYLNVIKEIIGSLKGLPFAFGTVSNGLLFTQGIVDFFNENNISVAISNDGANTKFTRGIDVLAIPKITGIMKNINDLSIDSVFSAYNCDYNRTYDYVYEKLGREVPIMFEWLHCDKSTPKQLYSFDYEAYQESLARYFDSIRTDLLNQNISHKVMAVLKDAEAIAEPSEVLAPRCKQMRGSLNLDLQGNIMACHPGKVLGDTSSRYAEMLETYDREINQAFSFADCANCKWVMACKAGCPLELPCEGKLAVCRAKRMYYDGLSNLMREVVTIC